MPAISYRPRYTVSDYEKWEGKWELWDGIPVSMAPSPNFGHMKLAQALAFSFGKELEAKEKDCGDCQVLWESDWRIDEHTVLRPDVMVICGEEPPADGWVTETPTLVAEVLSSSTEQRDRIEKKQIYESLGVSHYLILDPGSKKLEHFRLVDGAFVPQNQEPLAIHLHDDCKVELIAERLFR